MPCLFRQPLYGATDRRFRGGIHIATLTFLTVGLLATGIHAASPNLAGEAMLPSGKGLASSHPGDTGLKHHPDVIFADDFETGELGSGWDETSNKNGQVLSYAAPGKSPGPGARCLSVETHLGRDTGGGLTRWFPPACDQSAILKHLTGHPETASSSIVTFGNRHRINPAAGNPRQIAAAAMRTALAL